MADSANRVIHNQCVRVEGTRSEGQATLAALPELSVVVPVHNEAGNVAPLIEEIVLALSALTSFEIIYVDDGSSDDTPTMLTTAMAATPMLRVLRHARRSGQSTAIRTGAWAARGRWD